MLKWIAPALLAATPALAEGWVPLTGPQITEALTDKALRYTDASQDFRASGRTLYVQGGRDSWGYWAVRGDQYCSQWPPADGWACYDMARSPDGQSLRFIGESGAKTDGTYK